MPKLLPAFFLNVFKFSTTFTPNKKSKNLIPGTRINDIFFFQKCAKKARLSFPVLKGGLPYPCIICTVKERALPATGARRSTLGGVWGRAPIGTKDYAPRKRGSPTPVGRA